jgi:hypothetical protein
MLEATNTDAMRCQSLQMKNFMQTGGRCQQRETLLPVSAAMIFSSPTLMMSQLTTDREEVDKIWQKRNITVVGHAYLLKQVDVYTKAYIAIGRRDSFKDH